MNEYRSRLKIQNILFSIGAAALIAIQILSYARIVRPISADEHWADFWNGFIAGVACGVTILLIIGIIRNLIGLRSEASLKKLFIKEHDERKGAIYTKGKSAGATLSVCFMLVAGIISGYFSITVFITCMACVLSLSLFMVGGKFYYGRKM